MSYCGYGTTQKAAIAALFANIQYEYIDDPISVLEIYCENHGVNHFYIQMQEIRYKISIKYKKKTMGNIEALYKAKIQL